MCLKTKQDPQCGKAGSQVHNFQQSACNVKAARVQTGLLAMECEKENAGDAAVLDVHGAKSGELAQMFADGTKAIRTHK